MQKQLSRHQRAGFALVVSVIAILVFFTLAGCTVRNNPTIPNVVGMSPYEAKQLLEREISDAQVDFVTTKGTNVMVESSEHYLGWEVVATEPSTEMAISDDGSKEILVTIRMTDLEAEERSAIISDHMQKEIISGWPEGSITYYDSDEVLIIRYQGSVPSYVFESAAADVPSEHTLAESLNGTILTVCYTSDNYLEGIIYNQNINASPDQIERAKTEAKRIMEEADAYANGHCGELVKTYVDWKFGALFGDPKNWRMEYTSSDGSVEIAITLPQGMTFISPKTSISYEEIVATWVGVADRFTKYTRSNVVFRFYSSSGDLQIMAGSTAVWDYVVSDELKDVLPATPQAPPLPM